MADTKKTSWWEDFKNKYLTPVKPMSPPPGKVSPLSMYKPAPTMPAPRVQSPFQPAPQPQRGISPAARSFYTGVKDTAASIVRAIPQTGARINMAITGKESITPNSKLTKFIYGNEPVKNFEGYGKDVTKLAQDLGWKGAAKSKSVNIGVGLALSALDVTGFGGGKKQLAEKLAKEMTEVGVRKIALKNGVELTEKAARAIAKEQDALKIAKTLEQTEKVAQAAKTAEKAVQKGEKIKPSTNPTIFDEMADTAANKKKSVIKEMATKVETPSPIVGSKPSVGQRILQTAIVPGKVTLAKQGEAGSKLTGLLENFKNKRGQLAGKFKVPIDEVLRPNAAAEVKSLLSRAKNFITGQKDQVAQDAVDFLRGEKKVVSQESKDLATVFKTVLADVYKEAVSAGVDVTGHLKKYFPKIYDWNKLNKPDNRLKALQHMVDTGQAKSLTEAEGVFDNFIANKGLQKSGSLEHHRVLDLPKEYEVDPLKAMDQYIEDNSRRISEVKYFGANGEKANALIDEIAAVGKDRQFAKEVFELVTGLKHYDNKAVDAAVKLSYLTKLSLSFITNATQPGNTMVKAGIVRTLSDIFEVIGSPYKSGRKAMLTGAVEDAITKGQAEGVNMDSLMKTVMGIFQMVERKNRTIASLAGEKFSQDISQELINYKSGNFIEEGLKKLVGRDAGYYTRQLESLGLNPVKIVEQGGLSPDDILHGGKGMSDTTQFVVDAMELPPGWKTNIGRALTNLKSFSYKQTIFVYNEVIKEAAHGNVMPLIRLAIVSAPLYYGSKWAKRQLMGGDAPAEEKPDWKKPGTYLNAMAQGTLPYEYYKSGQYVAKQLAMDNDVITPVQKGTIVASNILGPAAGEPATLLNKLLDIERVTTQNEKYGIEKAKADPYLALKKYLVEKIPFGGKNISNTFFPWPKSEPKTPEEKAQAQAYYDSIETVEKTYTTKELTGSRLLHASGNGTDMPIPTQMKAAVYLNLPNVLKGDTAVYRNQKDHDPFYDLNPKQQNAVLLSQQPLPGESADLKKAVLYSQDWYAGYQAKRNTYFENLDKKLSADGKQRAESDYPEISGELKAKQDKFFTLGSGKEKQAFLQANPDLIAYWDAKDNYVNNQREKLGMPPMPETSSSGGSGSYSSGGYSARQQAYMLYLQWKDNFFTKQRLANARASLSGKLTPPPANKMSKVKVSFKKANVKVRKAPSTKSAGRKMKLKSAIIRVSNKKPSIKIRNA